MWQIRKPEFVERVVEPGLSIPSEAAKETAPQLSPLLKSMKKPVKKMLPSRLSSMKHAQLQKWCLDNTTEQNKELLYYYNVQVPGLTEYNLPKIREQIIHSINSCRHIQQPDQCPPSIG